MRSSVSVRLAALVALPFAAVLHVALAPAQEAAVPATVAAGATSGDLVLDRYVQYEGRPVHIRFEAQAKQLVVVGEADRPFVYQANEGHDALWWTTLADLREAPEIEYLLREEARRRAIDPDKDVLDLPRDFRANENLALVPVRMGTQVSGRINANVGETDPNDPAHYRALTSTSPLRPYLLVNGEGRLDLVIPATCFEGLFFEGEMEGQGADAARFGGLRLDLVFHGILAEVPPESMQWLAPIAYDSLPLRHFEPEPSILDFRTR